MNEPLTYLVPLSSHYTILYVEDDSDAQEEVARTLRRLFKEVYAAGDGEEGLAQFKQHAPSLVISDIQMPRKNGLDMVSAIKEISPAYACCDCDGV
jgi:CheY-like chemotaxis protein